MSLISIVIPVLNEEMYLPVLLDRLQVFRRQGHEIIVVDGDSKDDSLKIAQTLADSAIVSSAGRARQMNTGAAVARGDMFLFLHCDTVLPDDALQIISSSLHDTGRQDKPYWGRFDVRLSSDRFVFRIIETLMNLRSRLTSVTTGDQAIFIESCLFDQVGGFPEIPLMEDIAMSKKLKEIASPICLKQKVTTSSRRWEKRGVVATVLLMWKLRLYYFLGMPADKLSQLYR
ncbi:MAG TPA: glycosyltransferase [Gammaproteobacteria bacterium]|nr:glycosyltransferase [Gammaproteobacteria bacterium]